MVIEDGRIGEVGTHEQLLARDGTFARLWRMQTEMARRAHDVLPEFGPGG